MSEEATLDEFVERQNKPGDNNGELREEGFLTLPYDWDISSVAEVAKEGGLVDGDWVESDDMDKDGEIQLVQLAHIGEGQFKGEPDRFITHEFAEEENCTLLSEGDLLISRMQKPILRSCLLPSFDLDSVMAVDIARLEETDDWNRHFLKYLFNSRPVWKQGIAWASGTTRKRISRTNIEKLQLPKPNLEEQCKIATVLHNVDQAIQNTDKIVRKLSTIRQGMRQDIFRGKAGNQSTKTTRTGPISVEIPCHWEIKNLGEFVDEFIGGATLAKSDFTESGISVLPKKAVSEGGIAVVNSDERQYCSEETAKENQTNLVDSNYLITALRDLNADAPSIGRIVKIDPDSDYPKGEKYLLAQGVHGLRTSSDISDNYLIELSNSGWYRRYVKSISVGSTQIHIRNNEFLSIEIPFPPLEEQKEIATQLRDIVSLQAKERANKAELERLKKGLMQDLLSGEVRTTDANIEVPDEIAQHG